ncbi:MAG: ABC transporter ATP-binding protein [Desulfocapsa sp.]|nr:ABC transporter ATP-binding protein [Desulfocapsa sp.]
MSSQSDTTPMLQMRGITKRFPGVLASDNVDFDVRSGEVHTLLGENGAGKSTLMKILYGLYQQDEGEILLNGKPVNLTSPANAISHGIGMIHQHFMLVPTLTVAENVSLGLKSTRGALTDLKTVSKRITELSKSFGLHVYPDEYIWQLSVGERQRVEIIKALYRDASILILDEPTAVLTPSEVDDIFVIFRKLAADGRGLVFISHKLKEVLDLSDRITVLRHGRVTGDTTPPKSDRHDLAKTMVGRAVKLAPAKEKVETGKPLLKIENLYVDGDRGSHAVQGLNLEVKSGEILGIAGISGNGQRELAEAIAGLRKVESGKISIAEKDTTSCKPGEIRKIGLSYVPEERMKDGAVGDFSVKENLILLNHNKEPFCKSGFLNFKEINRHSEKLVKEYAVKTPGIDTTTKNLSGGNIQKVIMARELSAKPKVLIASQPTRGVDIGAAEYIHERISEQRQRGTASVVISEDLDEVMALSDRIAVMFDGKIMGIIKQEDATRESIGLMMTGESV